jgi:polysaccharide pyruvyl transferase WcaK-like protein
MLCYDNYDIIFTNNWLHERGVRTILWGCSMGPENQTKRKLETLFNFSLIYTRESLTYDYFQSLGLKNLCVMPDPAFVLQPQPFELPSYFKENDLVGLNISKYVTGGMTMNSRFGKELINLIGHILKETTFHILLVPHVTWNVGGENQVDRKMPQIIRKHFGNPERLHILDIDNLNYCQIRHAISKCRMFIGARTHAVISAYSECVPAIALGYSIKSRGIAKDLGLDEKLVVNSKDFSEGAVLRSFSYLMKNEDSIRKHLQDTIPEYKKRTYQIREHLITS